MYVQANLASGWEELSSSDATSLGLCGSLCSTDGCGVLLHQCLQFTGSTFHFMLWIVTCTWGYRGFQLSLCYVLDNLDEHIVVKSAYYLPVCSASTLEKLMQQDVTPGHFQSVPNMYLPGFGQHLRHACIYFEERCKSTGGFQLLGRCCSSWCCSTALLLCWAVKVRDLSSSESLLRLFLALPWLGSGDLQGIL